ncbi:hypothetical protein V8E36_006838 [Tilletia maclaganii]
MSDNLRLEECGPWQPLQPPLTATRFSVLPSSTTLSVMQLSLAGLFVAALCASGVQAKNAHYEIECQKYAQANCVNHDALYNKRGFDYLRFHCLRLHWETMTLNDKCPHPAAGCTCYNGCVQDRSGSVTDVGGWCTNACKIGGGDFHPCVP